MEIAAVREEMNFLREEMKALREEMTNQREETKGCKSEVTNLKTEMKRQKEENTALHSEVVRLQQAMVEERSTRQTVVEELRQEVRRLTAPFGRLQGLVPREQEEGVETQVPLDRAQVHELEDRLNQALVDQKRAEDDLKESRATNSATETKLRETEARNEDLLEQTNASLKKRLHEMERTLDHERSSSKDKDEVIKRQLEEMQQQKEKQQALMNTKVALDAEISAFNKLLESKNTRLVQPPTMGIKKLCFPPGLSEKSLTNILQNSEGMEELTVTAPSDSTGQWVRLLPPSLRKLDVFGPGETGESVTVPKDRQLDHGLDVVIKQAGEDVINQLASELGQRVTSLAMFNKWRCYGQVIGCPRVTAGALQRLLSALTGLEDVTLNGTLSGAITDASLAALHGCSQLRVMQLGDSVYQCTDIPVTAVSRLAVTCRKLDWLSLHAKQELSQTVLDGLVEADLGKRDDGKPRTLRFNVPGAVYDKLSKPSNTGNIKVVRDAKY
ncbi:dynactin, 150 kDa isoform-like isoform X2 [Amphibalanus amphitrite]|uniref:dynactin, 150 kDa isoform-like isoform X2 n=1 Tax=Amphibalanus amphitrite TaxID=1232801 RepID=UPI001C9143AF|nr:dynactin, 150 kDa isoform-like isoform X2 [Amphibalanus amphitrite]